MDINKETKKERDERKERERSSRRLGLVLGLVVLGVALVFGGVWLSGRGSGGGVGDLADVGIVTTADHILGTVDNPQAVLIEYSDFQCPACATYEPFIKELVADYGDKGLMFVYRHYPLAQYNKAIMMAQAAEAAGQQGEFWAMHDFIFGNQADWSQKNPTEALALLSTYAEELGLDIEKFKADMREKKINDKIKADMDSGNRAGINATPTFFLNGRKVEVRTLAEFKVLIESTLSIEGDNNAISNTTISE